MVASDERELAEPERNELPAAAFSSAAHVPVAPERVVAQVGTPSVAALEAEATKQLPFVRQLDGARTLVLIRLLAPALRELSAGQRSVFSRTLEALIAADGRLSLFECVVAETLRSRLEEEPRAARSLARVRCVRSRRSWDWCSRCSPTPATTTRQALCAPSPPGPRGLRASR